MNKKNLAILVIFFFIVTMLLIQIDTKKGSNNKQTNYLILFTSYLDNLSEVGVFDQNGTQLQKYSISKNALTNIEKKNNTFYISSIYNGEYVSLNNNGSLKNHTTIYNKGITNSFSNNEYLLFLTNWGQEVVNGTVTYKSGIYLFHNNKDLEFSFNNGFFTNAVIWNNFLYVLTFDPAKREEQLLKFNTEGNLLNIFHLGNKPIHSHRSMAYDNNFLYLFSDEGTMVTLDSLDHLDIRYIDIYQSSNDLLRNEIFKVIRANQDIYVLYYDGNLLKISDGNLIQKIKLEIIDDEPLIGIEAFIESNTLHILFTLDGRKHGYSGLIRKYNIFDGSVEKEIYIPHNQNLRISDFHLVD